MHVIYAELNAVRMPLCCIRVILYFSHAVSFESFTSKYMFGKRVTNVIVSEVKREDQIGQYSWQKILKLESDP